MTPMRVIVESKSAPAAIGPYSQAVRWGDLLFCSGALPVNPADGELDDTTLGAETARCLLNLDAVCHEAGTSLHNAVRITIYTTDLASFEEINAAYAQVMNSEGLPARVTIGVAALPKGARVEIDAVVAVP